MPTFDSKATIIPSPKRLECEGLTFKVEKDQKVPTGQAAPEYSTV